MNLYLVILPHPLELFRITHDEKEAIRIARNLKGMYLEIPIKADYRCL
jgi:hypothetical protein